MSAHTPGPWQLRQSGAMVSNKDRQDHQITGPDGRFLASVDARDTQRQGSPHNRANARLIAAAPDLLASLKALSRAFDLAILRGDLSAGTENSDPANAASAAVARAEGKE